MCFLFLFVFFIDMIEAKDRRKGPREKMIKEFQIQDTEQVMEIWFEGNVGAHDFVPREYWASQYRMVQQQLLQADIYVYERDGRIRGFAGMMGDYLAGIFVEGNYRSMGIGKSLLNYIKEIYPMFSLKVYQKNQRAVDFYLREGLRIVSEGMDEDTAEAEYTMIWKKR